MGGGAETRGQELGGVPTCARCVLWQISVGVSYNLEASLSLVSLDKDCTGVDSSQLPVSLQPIPGAAWKPHLGRGFDGLQKTLALSKLGLVPWQNDKGRSARGTET